MSVSYFYSITNTIFSYISQIFAYISTNTYFLKPLPDTLVLYFSLTQKWSKISNLSVSLSLYLDIAELTALPSLSQCPVAFYFYSRSVKRICDSHALYCTLTYALHRRQSLLFFCATPSRLDRRLYFSLSNCLGWGLSHIWCPQTGFIFFYPLCPQINMHISWNV